MADPAQSSRHRGKGGEWGRGSPPNFFFQPFRPQFGVNIRGGASPGSTTDKYFKTENAVMDGCVLPSSDTLILYKTMKAC